MNPLTTQAHRHGEENRDCPACKGTGLTLVQPPLENETRVRLQRAGSVSLPSREELALWRSRCAPVSGNWQDMALHRCCMALLGEGTPNGKHSNTPTQNP